MLHISIVRQEGGDAEVGRMGAAALQCYVPEHTWAVGFALGYCVP